MRNTNFFPKIGKPLIILACIHSFLLLSCARYPAPHDFKEKDLSFKLTVDHGGRIRNFGTEEPDPFNRLRTDLIALEKHLRSGNYTHIAVIVHGGLVGPQTASKESDLIAKSIKEDNTASRKIFPIFINWDTSPLNSYGRHLVSDEAGITSAAPGLGPFSPEDGYMMPLKFVGDLGAGLSRAPVHLLRSIIRYGGKNPEAGIQLPYVYPAQSQVYRNLAGNFPAYRDDHRKTVNAPFSINRRDFRFNFHLGGNDVPPLTERAVAGLVWTPVKLASSPLADSIGSPAWDNMKRRAKLLAFHPQNRSTDTTESDRSRGPGNLLFTSLAKICQRNPGLKLELYGHSMGTIVINEILSSTKVEGYGPCPRIDKVVYMAAACSISDFMNTTGNHVVKNKIPFHNLTLHPVQEVRESICNDAGSPLVSGSLLTWIDEMFERPPSFQDRTLGTFNNVVIARDLLPKGRNVHIKAFPAAFEKGKLFRRDKMSVLGPQKHGDFNNYRFWNPEFHKADSKQSLYTPFSEN